MEEKIWKMQQEEYIVKKWYTLYEKSERQTPFALLHVTEKSKEDHANNPTETNKCISADEVCLICASKEECNRERHVSLIGVKQVQF